jgi:hypothetical protein
LCFMCVRLVCLYVRLHEYEYVCACECVRWCCRTCECARMCMFLHVCVRVCVKEGERERETKREREREREREMIESKIELARFYHFNLRLFIVNKLQARYND